MTPRAGHWPGHRHGGSDSDLVSVSAPASGQVRYTQSMLKLRRRNPGPCESQGSLGYPRAQDAASLSMPCISMEELPVDSEAKRLPVGIHGDIGHYVHHLFQIGGRCQWDTWGTSFVCHSGRRPDSISPSPAALRHWQLAQVARPGPSASGWQAAFRLNLGPLQTRCALLSCLASSLGLRVTGSLLSFDVVLMLF